MRAVGAFFLKKVFRRPFSREMRGEGKKGSRFDLRLACILMGILFFYFFLFFNFYGQCGAGAPPHRARGAPPPSPPLSAPSEEMASDGLSVQSLDNLDVGSLTPLTPEVISRQATINIGTIGACAREERRRPP